jgi:hypothetical protein
MDLVTIWANLGGHGTFFSQKTSGHPDSDIHAQMHTWGKLSRQSFSCVHTHTHTALRSNVHIQTSDHHNLDKLTENVTSFVPYWQPSAGVRYPPGGFT